MEKLVIIYSALIERIILCCYILIFSLNIFHFHKYDFNRNSTVNTVNESNLRTKISISEFDCIIHQIFSSLHTLITPNSSVYSFNDITKPSCLIGPFRSDTKQIIFSKNHLRAPPFFS